MPNSPTFEIPLPLEGLEERLAFGNQTPLTSQRMINVLVRDPVDGRARLCQRWGLSKYTAMDFGADITAIDHLIRHRQRVTYTIQVMPDAEQEIATPSRLLVPSLDVDLEGNVYAANGLNQILSYSRDGKLRLEHNIETIGQNQIIKSIKTDSDGSVYAAIAGNSSATDPGWVVKWHIKPDRLAEGRIKLVQDWIIGQPDILGQVPDFAIDGDSIYFLENTGSGNYSLHRWEGILGSRPYKVWKVDETTMGNPIALAVSLSGYVYVSIPFGTSPFTGNAGLPGKIRKYTTRGDAVWSGTGSLQSRYLGWGLVVDQNDVLTTMGVQNTSDRELGLARFADTTTFGGTTVAAPTVPGAVTDKNTWFYDTGYSMSYQGPNTIAVDEMDPVNVYAAITEDSGSGLTNGESAIRVSFQSGGPSINEDWKYTLGTSVGGLAIAPDPKLVDSDLKTLHVWLGLESDADEELHRLQQYDETIADQPQRELLLGVVEQGDLNVYDVTNAIALSPSGATGNIDPNKRFVSIIKTFDEWIIPDGITYWRYDPLGDAQSGGNDGTLTEFRANKGEALPRCKLGAVQWGRLILARGDDARTWGASRQGDYMDWDIAPIPTDVGQAVISTTGGDGGVNPAPDLINALMPYDDDRLIFGCDSTIWQFTGDPGPGAGGQFDRLADGLGVAYGTPFAKDPEGTLYFWANHGGIYQLRPGSPAVPLSDSRIQTRLSAVNHNTHRISLAWDLDQRSLLVFITPFDSGGTRTEGYQWVRDQNAWCPISLANADLDPLAVHVIDGDRASDRAVIMGGRDGFVRKIDPDTKSDDGLQIVSRCFIGPVRPAGKHRENIISGINAVLDFESDSVQIRAHAYDRPELPLSPLSIRYTKTVLGGRNKWSWETVAGPNVFFELYNDITGTRWALDMLEAQARDLGMAKLETL